MLLYIQVTLQFSDMFWRSKVKGDAKFGIAPESDKTRGLFNSFYPITIKTKQGKETIIIVSSHQNRIATALCDL